MSEAKYHLLPHISKCLVTQALIAINIGWIVIALLNSAWAQWLVSEDGFLEWIQFCLYLMIALKLLARATSLII